MNAPKLRHAPEQHNSRSPRPKAQPAPELLVQYPNSSKFSVFLPDHAPLAGIAPLEWRTWPADRFGPPAAGAETEWEGVPEPGRHFSWLMAVAGLAIVAFLWSAILL